MAVVNENNKEIILSLKLIRQLFCSSRYRMNERINIIVKTIKLRKKNKLWPLFAQEVIQKLKFPDYSITIDHEIIEPPYGFFNFLKTINTKGLYLDVGCGNNSPLIIKSMFPDIYYVGIDVGDYNQTKSNPADEYIITDPDEFSDTIEKIDKKFDTVISSHNLEHCNDRTKTLAALIKALKPDGYLYLSFPAGKSILFPGPRIGCLNYYDDYTHKEKPPDFYKTIGQLKENGMEILFSSKSYKPSLMYIIGALTEWESKRDKEIKMGTWAYWGFETIIWAKKKSGA